MIERAIYEEIAAILLENDIGRKLERAAQLCARAERAGLASDSTAVRPMLSSLRPGRPPSWQVADALGLPERPRLTTHEGRYLLMHSVANIELSAVELALAAVADFPGFPEAYYRDWLRVAGEEVAHARMVELRLRELGGQFGDAPIHLGLWETASAYPDPLERLGVVPRILEARGLDVSARLRAQLRSSGDAASAEVLAVIYRDEIGHVATGSRWFAWICREQDVDPETRFVEIWQAFARSRGGRVTAIDREGRRAAGFSERELDALSVPEARPT